VHKIVPYPTKDPHGEPIPDKHGNINQPEQVELQSLAPGYKGKIVAVKDSDSNLLKYLNKIGAKPGKKIKIISREPFDESLEIEIATMRWSISRIVAENILVTV
jgi:DtxR family Mn-dependent transcriptional regulator